MFGLLCEKLQAVQKLKFFRTVIYKEMNRLDRRIRKFLDEERHYQYLLKRGMEPLEIADQLIHILLTTMEESVKKQYPNANKEEIREKMLQRVDLYKKMKNIRRKKYNERNKEFVEKNDQ